MPKHLLSIGMPSKRNLADSASSIHNALEYCLKEGHQFVLADNSGDPAKEQAYTADGKGMHYIKNPPCSAAENWRTAFDATDGEFVMMMGDDDGFFSFAPAPDFSNVDAHVAGIKPTILAYFPGQGIRKVDNRPILSPTGAERVVENLQNAGGTNLGFFSFWRRTLLKSVMDLWMIHHPTKGAYADWAAMNGLISSGTAILNPSVCYFYNLSNWMGSEEKIAKEVEKLYVKDGLPSGTAPYQTLFSGLDSFIFIGRKDSPLPAPEREQAATAALTIYLKHYIDLPSWTTSHANAKEIETLSKKLVGNTTVEQIFTVISDILDAIRPNLGREYRDYYAFAIGKPWGTF